MPEWPSIYRRSQEWPPVNPSPQELRTATFIPNGSVTDAHMRDVSARKFQVFGARVYDSSTTLVGAGGTVAMTWDTEDFDIGNLWVSTAATRLTLPFAGMWLFQAILKQSAGSGNLVADLKINGTTEVTFYSENSLITQGQYAHRAAVDDYVEVDAREIGGANSGTVGAGVANNHLLATFLGGI